MRDRHYRLYAHRESGRKSRLSTFFITKGVTKNGMKVQIIGLPCSGKTTSIKKYLQKNKDITYIDIREFSHLKKRKQKEYRSAITKASGKVIAESACGVSLRGTEVIRLETDMQTLYKRSKSRDSQREEFFDEDYLSLLDNEMIPAKYTVTTQEAFENILDQLFNQANT